MIGCVLLDLSGVVYEGKRPVSGSVEAIERLRRHGLPIRFITNTTRTPKRELVDRLEQMRLSVSAEEIFTPARAACDWLEKRNLSPFLLVHPDLEEEFASFRGHGQETVVIGDAGENFTYDALNAAFRLILQGSEFIALARNRTFKDEDGELSLDAGAFVAGLEYACQREAVLLGKPSPDFYATALSSMNCSAENAAMIGDDAEADVSGALLSGIKYALLVRTGKYRSGDEFRFDPPPTAVVSDLSEAVEWIISNT